MTLHGLLSEPAEIAAPRLLNCVIASHGVTIRITEVEAYGGVGVDAGSHAYRRRTPRNATMFGPAGIAYVYLSHGIHWCLNVVAGRDGTAAAILLRAGEVVDGADIALDHRGGRRPLASGPGRLAQALGIDGSMDGVDLLDPASPLRLLPGAPAPGRVLVGPRTGVSGDGAATPWRFHLADEPSVSAYRAAAPSKRHLPR